MVQFNKMTEQQFQEILLDIFNKGQENNVEITEIINEIKEQMLLIMSK